MACLAIDEIRDTVRLIDMGFHPLFKELFDTVIKSESEVQALLYFAQFLSAWNLFAAEVKCFPVISLISAATRLQNSGCELITVPFVIKIDIYVKVTQKIRRLNWVVYYDSAKTS
jgi:type III secretory pathway component EscS